MVVSMRVGFQSRAEASEDTSVGLVYDITGVK